MELLWTTALLCLAALQQQKLEQRTGGGGGGARNVAMAATDAADLGVLQGILALNPNLPWDSSVADPCGQGAWQGVLCKGSRVTELQLKNMALKGALPPDFNKLTELEQLGLQGNAMTGELPSFSGMSKLVQAFLTGQSFSAIPSDFFSGLTSLQILSLEDNPLNRSYGGWSLPDSISDAIALISLDLTNSSLSGPVPFILSTLTSLQSLYLSYNGLYGSIPSSFASLSQLSTFHINNQASASQKLSGSISVFSDMLSLRSLWLHVNGFAGTIPDSIANRLVSLQDLRLNDNAFVGLVPWTLDGSQTLHTLFLHNNRLLGPLPAIANTSAANYTFYNNNFCTSEIGVPCDPQLSALLSFMKYVDFPSSFTATWDGLDPCTLPGVSCANSTIVTGIVRRSLNLSGTISPDLANLTYLATLDLSHNNLTGIIPESLTGLQHLLRLDLSYNNLYGPVPDFDKSRIKVNLDGNPSINEVLQPPPPTAPPGSSRNSTGAAPLVSESESGGGGGGGGGSSLSGAAIGVAAAAAAAVVVAVVVVGCVVWRRRRKAATVAEGANSDAAEAGGGGDSGSGSRSQTAAWPTGEGGGGGDMVKVTVDSGRVYHLHVAEGGGGGGGGGAELVISIEVLRRATNDFSEENVVGRGGFGVVYKGEMADGTKVAVKRMVGEMAAEFEAEIGVLTKVRHRNLVSLLGYCVNGGEKLLVYEYMALGSLSDHLFERRRAAEGAALEWEKRLSIALDVARGVEYLHSLAQQMESFIHRDLKASNILLDDRFKAKVSDFGLVKSAGSDDGSMAMTRVAGTFGYLAPEYAFTGRITTKSDVFSFGVVLMELISGRQALDQSLPPDSAHLVSWFRRHLKCPPSSSFPSLLLDPALLSPSFDPLTSHSISVVGQLAVHCTAREPLNRPDMSHAVNVLSPLVQRWEPMVGAQDEEEEEEEEGEDSQMSLLQAVAKWQAYDGGSSMSTTTTTTSSNEETNSSRGSSAESMKAARIGTMGVIEQSINALHGR